MNMKQSSKLCVAGVTSMLAIASSLVVAEPYRGQINLDYVTGNIDSDDFNVDTDNFTIGGSFYFDAVARNNLALAEAPFMSRTSFLYGQLGISNVDEDLSYFIDEDTYTLGGRFIARESGWYGDLKFTEVSKAIESPGGINLYRPEFDGYVVEFGKYVGANTTVGAVASLVEYDNSDFGFNIRGLDELATLGLTFKHVGQLTENWAHSFSAIYHFVDLKANDFDRLDDDPFDNNGQVYSASYMLYPVETFGFGLNYASMDDLGGQPFVAGLPDTIDGLGLKAQWFATDNWSFSLLYTNGEYDIEDDSPLEEPGAVDEDFLTIRSTFRF